MLILLSRFIIYSTEQVKVVNSDGELEEKEKDAKLKEAKKEGEESKVLSSSLSFFLLFILHSVMYIIPMDRSFSV